MSGWTEHINPDLDKTKFGIHEVVNGITSTSIHMSVTPNIIYQCIHNSHKLGKDDGDLDCWDAPSICIILN